MLDGVLRPVKDRLLSPLVLAAARRVDPFVITGFAFLAGIGAAVGAYLGRVALSVSLWLLGRVLDGLDGAVARKRGSQSDLGGYVDIVLDVVVYTAVPLSLAFRSATVEALGAVSVLMGVFYINVAAWMYLAALLEKRRAAVKVPTSVVMPSGLIEGTETIVFYTLFLALPDRIVPLFIAMSAITALTVVQRLIVALRVLRRR